MVRNTINPWDPGPTREPPKRDEPKGGKKPRGFGRRPGFGGGRSGGGGAGNSFGGPNSGDEVDDDKGRQPPKPGNEMPDPRDYPVKNNNKWHLMIFAQIVNSRLSSGTSSINRHWWRRQEATTSNFRLNKIGLDVFIEWEESWHDSEYNYEEPIIVHNDYIKHRKLYPLKPYYMNSGCERVSLYGSGFNSFYNSEYNASCRDPNRLMISPLFGSIFYRLTPATTWTDVTTVWTKDPEAMLEYIHLWEVPYIDRGHQSYYEYESDVLWDAYRGRSYENTRWYPVFPTSTRLNYTSLDGPRIWENTRNYSYKLWILSEDKDYLPPENNVRQITIPDMNEECCGMIRRIYEFLDPESFPAEMPTKITVDADNPDNGIKEIKTLPEWLMYRFDIDDERWGEFEVKVEINDINLLSEEQEEVTIKLPNIAESIAEIFGLVMEIAISHQVTQNAVLTCLHEAGLAHAAAFKAGREVSEILDYLGFKTEEKYEKLKTAFTPEADNFEELLEPNESKVKITNQKNAKETLETALNQIKEIFSIVRAQGTLQVNGNDPSKDILADLTRLYDSMKKQDEIREQETNKVKELLKKDFPDIKIETELIDGDNPLRETL
ncbi:hypothetical protein AP9108_34620 [Arthrospira sp. PCC 9108]|nr:hypothetical protein AP9108_34620 [Arthrospira sp. PCC 9108]